MGNQTLVLLSSLTCWRDATSFYDPRFDVVVNDPEHKETTPIFSHRAGAEWVEQDRCYLYWACHSLSGRSIKPAN
jgi:hypothetical protein